MSAPNTTESMFSPLRVKNSLRPFALGPLWAARSLNQSTILVQWNPLLGFHLSLLQSIIFPSYLGHLSSP